MTTKNNVLLAGLIFFTTTAIAQVKKTITPVLNAGEQYIFRNSIITDIHEDGVRAINQNYSTSWFLRIIGKTDNGKLMIRATYLKLHQKTEQLFTHDVKGFNSDDFKQYVAGSTRDDLRMENERLRKLGEGMMGKTFTVYLNPGLDVDRVTGVDTLIESALQGMDEEDPGFLQAYSKTVKGTVNNEELKTIFRSLFAYVPDEPVGIGDKWTKEENHNIGPLQVEYIVKEEKEGNMDIAVSSASAINNDIQVSYSRKGTVIIDTKTGLPVQSSVKDDMKPRAGNFTRLVIKTVKNELHKK